MKIVRNKVKFAALIFAFLCAFSLSLYVYIRANARAVALKGEISDLETRLDELTEKSLKSIEFNHELKYINYEMNKIQTVVPPRLEQERILLAIRRIEKASGVKFALIKFRPVDAFSEGVKPPAADENGEKKDSGDNAPDLDEGAAKKTPEPLSARSLKAFTDGDKLRMQMEIEFRGKYDGIKKMLLAFPREKYRMVIDEIRIFSEAEEVLHGEMSVTAYALLDFEKALIAWEEEAQNFERGAIDLFFPLGGYAPGSFVILPDIDEGYKSPGLYDFYLNVSAYNEIKPAVLIGKFGSLDSEIFYDGNDEISINLYLEEKEGQVFFRTRADSLPYPDEKNTVHFFPRGDAVNMLITADPLAGKKDKMRVHFNIYNNTKRELIIEKNDPSGRVELVVKQGRVAPAGELF